MTVTGGKRSKTGIPYRTYSCASRHNRGRESCTNRMTISRQKIESAIITQLRDKILSNASITELVGRFRGVEVDPHVVEPDDDKMKHELAALATAIGNLVDHIARGGTSDAVAQALDAAERKKRLLEAELSKLSGDGPVDDHLSDEAVRAGLVRLREVLAVDDEHSRSVMQQMLPELRMQPHAASDGRQPSRGYYEVSGVCHVRPVRLQARVLGRTWRRLDPLPTKLPSIAVPLTVIVEVRRGAS
jgi:hypothetical protein